ncbi:MAG: tetratricopeptide repeat protein [Myxococcales bacterium]|nr:tetratricopeptide repeat protein [Myxococcales bacterium]
MRAEDLERALDGLALPADAEAPLRAAHAQLVDGRPDDSLEALARLGRPQEPAVALLTGLAHLGRFDLFRAERTLTQLVAHMPVFVGLLALARVRVLQEDVEGAAELLRRALQARPDHAGAIAALAECYVVDGRYERAEALARRGLELHPTATALLFVLADALRCQERHVEAVAVLRRLLPLDATAEAPRVALGRSLLALERPAEARPIFEEVLRRNAESTGALAGMAEALAQEGRLGEAHGYVLRAMAAAPDQAWLHLLHAHLNLRSGRLDQAEMSAETAATLTDAPREALRIAVRAATGRGDFERAAEHARALLGVDASDALGHAATGLAEVLAGRAGAARERLTAQLARRAPDPDLLLALGAAELAAGQAAQAAERFRAVIRLRADDRWAQPLLGAAYAGVNDPDASGERLLRRALAGEPVGEDDDDEDDDDETYVVEPPTQHGAPPPATARRASGPIAPLLEAAVNRLLAEEDGSIAPPPEDLEPLEPPPAAQVTPPSPALEPPLPPPPDPGGSVESRSLAGIDLSPAPTPSHGGDRPPAEVVERLHRLGRVLAGAEGLADLASRVDRLIEGHDQPLLLAVVGRSGAGKTTFVNALIGQPLIPEDTRVPHLLRYGRRPSARVVFHDGRIETVRPQALREVVARAGVDGDDGGVRRVEILMPVQELVRASILDLPDPLADGALSAGDVDGVLWLIDAEASEDAWAEAAAWLDAHGGDALAVVTRADRVAGERVVAQSERGRAALGGRVREVCVVSAQQGLEGLRHRDVGALRESGFPRLHKALGRAFFHRAGRVRGDAVARQVERLARAGLARVQASLDRVERQDAAVAALAERVARDREAFRREAEGTVPERLAGALEQTLAACAPEVGEAWAMPAGFERQHRLDGARARLRQGFVEGVRGAREALDGQLRRAMDGYFAAFEAIFPPDAQSAEAARVAGLQGILDGYRLLLLEEALGRHEAYLEGWVDQAPLEALLREPRPATEADVVSALRDAGLHLDRARAPKLQGLGGPLFDGIAAFVDETAADLRVARVDLTERLVEPLIRFLDGTE